MAAYSGLRNSWWILSITGAAADLLNYICGLSSSYGWTNPNDGRRAVWLRRSSEMTSLPCGKKWIKTKWVRKNRRCCRYPLSPTGIYLFEVISTIKRDNKWPQVLALQSARWYVRWEYLQQKEVQVHEDELSFFIMRGHQTDSKDSPVWSNIQMCSSAGPQLTHYMVKTPNYFSSYEHIFYNIKINQWLWLINSLVNIQYLLNFSNRLVYIHFLSVPPEVQHKLVPLR